MITYEKIPYMVKDLVFLFTLILDFFFSNSISLVYSVPICNNIKKKFISEPRLKDKETYTGIL